LPAKDIVLLGSTTNLLVEKSTHPAIQWAFMLASVEASRYSEDFFSKPGAFPKYVDLSFPLSPVAKRYYSKGVPVIFDYLPLWLASVIDNLWVVILTLFAVVYPIYKWIMGIRSKPSKQFMFRHFNALRELDEDVAKIKTREDANKLSERLMYLSNLNSYQWLSMEEVRFYFNLKNAVQSVDKNLSQKIAELDMHEKNLSSLSLIGFCIILCS